MENECEALPGVAYPGVRDNRSTINTKTGYDDDNDDISVCVLWEACAPFTCQCWSCLMGEPSAQPQWWDKCIVLRDWLDGVCEVYGAAWSEPTREREAYIRLRDGGIGGETCAWCLPCSAYNHCFSDVSNTHCMVGGPALAMHAWHHRLPGLIWWRMQTEPFYSLHRMQQERHLLSVIQAATNTERLWTQYQPTVTV